MEAILVELEQAMVAVALAVYMKEVQRNATVVEELADIVAVEGKRSARSELDGLPLASWPNVRRQTLGPCCWQEVAVPGSSQKDSLGMGVQEAATWLIERANKT